MCRFAAAEPFTMRAGFFLRAVDARRFAGARRATRFFRVVRFFRLVVFRFGRKSACTAGVCCANPAYPPGGTIVAIM